MISSAVFVMVPVQYCNSTPLQQAVSRGNESIVAYLVDQGAGMEEQDGVSIVEDLWSMRGWGCLSLGQENLKRIIV